MTVTRVEIADQLEEAFAYPPASKDDLIAYALARHARPEVIATLSGLPERSYRSLMDLWPHLAEVPVDH
ncbi:MAG: DUF2795 domain-containing protein [Streptosporangiales bacterium]|nr:DUF2795 domain-containing protein [Streptosporangiales bacterium]